MLGKVEACGEMVADTMDDHGADVVREVGETVLDCEDDAVVQRIAFCAGG